MLKDKHRQFMTVTIKKENKKIIKKIAAEELGSISRQIDYIIEAYARAKGYRTG